MSKVRSATIALFVISLPVWVGLILYGPFVLDLSLHRRPPARFLIPSGYVGWVRIEYGMTKAPPLLREGKYLVVRVDRNGRLQTSTELPPGWGRDQFFYDSGVARQPLSNAGWCKGGMIWGEESANQPSGVLQKFFVGNEDQFRMEVDPAGKVYSPCG